MLCCAGRPWLTNCQTAAAAAADGAAAATEVTASNDATALCRCHCYRSCSYCCCHRYGCCCYRRRRCCCCCYSCRCSGCCCCRCCFHCYSSASLLLSLLTPLSRMHLHQPSVHAASASCSWHHLLLLLPAAADFLTVRVPAPALAAGCYSSKRVLLLQVGLALLLLLLLRPLLLLQLQALVLLQLLHVLTWNLTGSPNTHSCPCSQ